MEGKNTSTVIPVYIFILYTAPLHLFWLIFNTGYRKTKSALSKNRCKHLLPHCPGLAPAERRK